MYITQVSTSEHIRLIHSWLIQPANAKWLDLGEIDPIPLARFSMMIRRGDDVYWLFAPDEKAAPVGFVALVNVSRRFASASPWIVLGDKHHSRKGLATQALRTLIDHAFSQLKLEVLHAWVVETNGPSIQVAKALNFRETGRQRQCHMIDQVRLDRLTFDLLRTEHQAQVIAPADDG